MKIFKIIIVLMLLIVSFAVGVMYEQGKQKKRQAVRQAEEGKGVSGVTVRAEKPVRRDMYETIRATGNLEASERTEVFSKIPGVVMECLVKESDVVKKGQPMAKLDSRELSLNLKQASSALNQAFVNMKTLEETLRRNEELYKESLISDQQIEQIRAQYEMAAAQVKSARVARDLANLNLSYTTVRAPMDGVVAIRNCESNKRVTTADNIFEIAALDKLEIKIFVTEDEVHRIKTDGRPVRLKFDALRGTPLEREYAGRVSFISPVVNPDNGTVEVRIEVPNEDGVLTEGMFARVIIETEMHENALAIPKQALTGEEGRYKVFIVKNNPTPDDLTAHCIDVVTGITDSEYVELLDGEVQPETLVISEGHNMLSEGDSVVLASPMGSQSGATAPQNNPASP